MLTPSNTVNLEKKYRFSEDLFNHWTCYIDASPKTIDTYKKAIKQFFIYLRDKGLKHPKREDIISYREQLKQNHKPATVQSYLAAVKLFFQWTGREGFYPNIADRVKGAKIDTEHKKDALTSKQVNEILGAVNRCTLKGKRDYAILSTMVTTGLRTISIINANIEDIRVTGDATVLFYKGKGHEEKAAYVKLVEPVQDAIKEYLTARGTTDAAKPLFSSVSKRNYGGRMTTRSISRVVKNSLMGANLTGTRLTAHSFRHTAATLNLLNGGTIEETRQLLNHSNINTTLIYSHALERAKNNSEQRIAKAIFG